MVVTWGIPGDGDFRYIHISNLRDAESWLQTQAAIEGVEVNQRGRIFTQDDEAAKFLRLSNGQSMMGRNSPYEMSEFEYCRQVFKLRVQKKK